MEQFSRPATLDDLKLLVRVLNEHNVEYLLIGGYALFVHGYHRSTVDIDILVEPSEDTGRKLRGALMLLPDRAARDIDPAWFVEGENIRIADEFVVDVMLNAGGQTYDTLKEHAETIEVDGLRIRTVNLEGLLRTKQSMREKDVADRIVIERALDVLRRRESEG